MHLPRNLAIVISIAITAGCGRPPANESGLYSDEEIRRLAPYDIDRARETAQSRFDIPCLDIVLSGSRPLNEVMSGLGLDRNRLQQLRLDRSDYVMFLTWQVSPSYDITVMTSINEELANYSQVNFDEPNRKVYGVRLVSRSKPLLR